MAGNHKYISNNNLVIFWRFPNLHSLSLKKKEPDSQKTSFFCYIAVLLSSCIYKCLYFANSQIVYFQMYGFFYIVTRKQRGSF